MVSTTTLVPIMNWYLHSEAREKQVSVCAEKEMFFFSFLMLWMFSMSFFSLYRVNFWRPNLVVFVVFVVFSVVVVPFKAFLGIWQVRRSCRCLLSCQRPCACRTRSWRHPRWSILCISRSQLGEAAMIRLCPCSWTWKLDGWRNWGLLSFLSSGMFLGWLDRMKPRTSTTFQRIARLRRCRQLCKWGRRRIWPFWPRFS